MNPILLPVAYHYDNLTVEVHEVVDRVGGLVCTCLEYEVAKFIIETLNKEISK